MYEKFRGDQRNKLLDIFERTFARESGFKAMNVDELKETYVKSSEYKEGMMKRMGEVRIGIFLNN